MIEKTELATKADFETLTKENVKEGIRDLKKTILLAAIIQACIIIIGFIIIRLWAMHK